MILTTTRLLLVCVFVLAFSAGASIGVAALDTHPADAPTPPKVATESDDQPIVWPANVGSPEQVLYAQAQRVQDAIDKLAPRTPGKSNLYLISFAGDGEENVFRNEVEYVEKLFTERFDAKGHVLTLINNPGTLNRRPIASVSNLELAVDALGKKLDPDEDVLMVFITTHGSREHELYVSLDPLPLDQIVPEDLADVFSESPIKHRVFVISACYSGGFIDALKGDSTMVITAARGDRASFGCGTSSDITDFGRAFFVDALNRTTSFTDAFADARKEIDTWETRDEQTHSLPQISTTPAIEAALKKWRDGFKPGPPVPFRVAARERVAPPRLRTDKPAHDLR
ncbi:MAG: caspase family protein [Proteobacteria bacterium]|uniref:C13 family peptidase n=1 Tax=Rudaea sp. TaxID=2136325 RepID=UPI0037833F9C|nr:caspase family protein [Pseudomonadota bacterium]